MSKEKALVGVDQLHRAFVTSDTSAAALWDAAVPILGVTEIMVNPNGAVASLFADNGVAITANSIGEIDVSIKTADLNPVERASMLGHTRTGGVTIYNGEDISPDLAIGFRTALSDGTYGYVWLLKGKFTEGQETIATKAGTTNFQVPTLSGKFSLLNYNGDWKRTTRADDPDFVAATGTNWFTNGPLGTTDTTAPTATCVPADAAASVAITANIVVTFSEAIQVSDITASNFLLMKATDGTVVATADPTYDSTHKVVTIDPTASLSAATAYIFVVTTNVKDLAGNALASPLVINFTTS